MFTNCVKIKRNLQGFIFIIGYGLIYWEFLKQTIISTLSTEFKLLILGLIAKETIAFKKLLNDFNLNIFNPIKIFYSNIQIIRLVMGQNTKFLTKFKYIDI